MVRGGVARRSESGCPPHSQVGRRCKINGIEGGKDGKHIIIILLRERNGQDRSSV